MEMVLSNGFCEMSMEDNMQVEGGIGWDDVGFYIVTGCGAVIGGAIGTALCPGAGTAGGAKAGSAIGSIIGGALFGAGYVLID